MKKQFVRIVAIALILVSVLTVCAPAFAVTGISVNSTAVTTKEARLRKTANKNSTCLATLSKNTKVTILATTNTYHGWYKVKYNGTTGYIREDFLKKSSGGSGSTLPQEIIDLYGSTNLKRGSTGQKVKQMLNDIQIWANHTGRGNQPMFKDLVKNCTRTGNIVTFEILAESALKEFQRCNGLSADGIFGDQSKTKLYNLVHK